MHIGSVTRLSWTRFITHCACDDAPSSPRQHPALHTDIQDGPLTTSTEQTAQDGTGRKHQTPPFCRQRSSSPRTRGHDPHDVDIGWAESAVNYPRLTVDGLGRVVPASASPQPGRTGGVALSWPLGPGTCSPTPARRWTRDSAMAPRLHSQRWASQARTGNELARHCTTAQEWTSASSGSEAVVWVGWGSPRGVSTFEKVSLAFCAARLRSSLATLWLPE